MYCNQIEHMLTPKSEIDLYNLAAKVRTPQNSTRMCVG